MRTALELLLWWGVLALLNVVFITQVTPLELAVGGALAALGALGAVAVRRTSGAALGPLAHAARALWAFPWTLLSDTGRLALLLLPGRSDRSGFRDVRLARGAGPAWAAALLSATPGAYAVATAGQVLTVHSLDPEVSLLERSLTGEKR